MSDYNIKVEVENGYGSNEPAQTFNTSLLAGLTSSLTSSQTESLIRTPFTGELAEEELYVSQSIVRLRLRADVIEPYDGFPTFDYHGTITANITNKSNPSDDGFTYIMSKTNPETEILNAGRVDGDVGHSQQTDKECLKVEYVSPFFEVHIKEGTHTFGVDFIEDPNTPLPVGFNLEPSQSATVTMNPATTQTISNIVVEVESGSFGTNIGHPNLTSSLLFGFSSSLRSPQTESYIENVLGNLGNQHPHYNDYINQSIVRLRVKSKISSPFIFGDNPDPNVVASFNVEGDIGGSTANQPITIIKDHSNTSFFSGTGNTAVANFIDLSNDFIFSGVTQVNITNIRVKGTFGSGQFLENFTVGGHNFGSVTSNGNSTGFCNTFANSTLIQNLNQPVNIDNGQVEIQFTPVGNFGFT